jgi:hypothetical protein
MCQKRDTVTIIPSIKRFGRSTASAFSLCGEGSNAPCPGTGVPESGAFKPSTPETFPGVNSKGKKRPRNYGAFFTSVYDSPRRFCRGAERPYKPDAKLCICRAIALSLLL